MSLDDVSVVDAMSLDKAATTATLAIFDAWDWSDEAAHLLALQEKLNTYFGFVQSGQVFEAYPKAQGKNICIGIMAKFPISAKGAEFLKIANSAASKLNVQITHQVLPAAS